MIFNVYYSFAMAVYDVINEHRLSLPPRSLNHSENTLVLIIANITLIAMIIKTRLFFIDHSIILPYSFFLINRKVTER